MTEMLIMRVLNNDPEDQEILPFARVKEANYIAPQNRSPTKFCTKISLEVPGHSGYFHHWYCNVPTPAVQQAIAIFKGLAAHEKTEAQARAGRDLRLTVPGMRQAGNDPHITVARVLEFRENELICHVYKIDPEAPWTPIIISRPMQFVTDTTHNIGQIPTTEPKPPTLSLSPLTP